MRPATTRPPAASTLCVAFELGNTEWKLAMTTRIDQAPLVCTRAARALKPLDAEIVRAQAHCGVPASAPVCTCCEAGRDGFWLHRYLGQRGISNRIVDSSSIEVKRRRRRTKTDRLDACKLVTMLIRADAGEKQGWSVVHVPTPTDEVGTRCSAIPRGSARSSRSAEPSCGPPVIRRSPRCASYTS